MTTHDDASRPAAATLGDVQRQLAALTEFTISELADKHVELYGEPTRSRNREYLRKRLAWRIQELAEGGLAAATLTKVALLGDELPERWRQRRVAPPPPAQEASTPVVATATRDVRLPPQGSVLHRIFDGATHEVTVRGDDFEYQGQHYRSLSAVARKISGTPWNGYTFFGLKAGPSAEETP